MLSSNFKEGTATEIPLPGKKANEVLDFLKVLYLKETEGITCKYEVQWLCIVKLKMNKQSS